MTKPIDLDELERLRARVRELEGAIKEHLDVGDGVFTHAEMARSVERLRAALAGKGEANNALIVAAVNALPGLIARVRELEGALREAADSLERLSDGECGSTYGPGCDTRCRTVAYRAHAKVSAALAGKTSEDVLQEHGTIPAVVSPSRPAEAPTEPGTLVREGSTALCACGHEASEHDEETPPYRCRNVEGFATVGCTACAGFTLAGKGGG